MSSVDSIPISDRREYITCDRNLTILQFSTGIADYTDGAIELGKDIRQSLPEIFGLEEVCQAILTEQQSNFRLRTICRLKQSQKKYFDLFIEAIEGNLVFSLEDVTQETLVQQSNTQRLNEAEVSLAELQRFEYCTNKIISSMRDLLLITSPLGKIERVNKSTTELFQRKKSELLDRAIDDLISDVQFNHALIYSSLLASPNSVEKIEVSCQINPQLTIQIEFDCFVAPTEVKNFYNCVYIGRDVTARKNAETEIRKSLAREKELRELKSGFISMASHEFRNPLSSILLCVQNLEENDRDNTHRQFYLQSIKDAALTMNLLLEDVLVLSQAESERQRLKLESINLKTFCDRIIQELSSIYANKIIVLDYQLESQLLDLDRTCLNNILNNLLSNALKYSPGNSTVRLNIFRQEPQQIVFQVCDRGIGIPPESQKHLFESFYRASNVNNFTGTGLGLSIVKKSVDLYGGTIAIDSQLDRGTTVTIILPIE